jgi:serine/threonine protein kinase
VTVAGGFEVDASVLSAVSEAAQRRRTQPEKAKAAKAARTRLPFAELERKRLLGTGTYGRVYLVSHQGDPKRLYALKCMRKGQVVKEKQQVHVLEETRLLRAMDHPFILNLVATYQDVGELYMLLELATGGELYYLLQKKAPLYDSHARFYAAQVVSIFSYMHAQGVVYRDLKPENLLLDADGYLKLVDFGFAKELDRSGRTWTLCGTPEYLAPEIILNKGHGFGVDWWCCGILTFELLCGNCPFRGSEMDLYRKIIKCNPAYPGALSLLARDFMTRLLCVDATRRLGCLKRGSTDVKNHPWFLELDWDALDAKALKPPHLPKMPKNFAEGKSPPHLRDDAARLFPNEDLPKDMFADFSPEWV